MRLSLRNNTAELSVKTSGAYIQKLSSDGRDIIFPAQYIGEKLRGGIPVCAPVFGPGEAVGLKQHGFARDVEWNVLRQSAAGVVLVFDAAGHAEIPFIYHGCAMQLTVKIRENSLFMSLTVENRGEEAFVCSPGFHPYFPTADATKVAVESDVTRQFDADALAATQFLPPHQEHVSVEVGAIKVTIASTTLQRYAVWSANPDRYICVEPTWAGNLADQSELPMLAPGERREFDMTMSWEVTA